MWLCLTPTLCCDCTLSACYTRLCTPLCALQQALRSALSTELKTCDDFCSLDATAEVPAALEQVTFAPALADVKVGGDDSLFSAVERIFITVNGYTNADDLPASANLTAHPSRQVRGRATIVLLVPDRSAARVLAKGHCFCE